MKKNLKPTHKSINITSMKEQSELKEHLKSARMLGKPVAFKKLQNFSDFFKSAEKWEISNKQTFKDRVVISSYCCVPDCSLNVKPTKKIIDCINKSMIHIDNDEIYFQVIKHKNNVSKVIAQYNQITGSRWLGYIRTNSIP